MPVNHNESQTALGEALKAEIQSGTSLSIIASHFTIYALYFLRREMAKAKEIRFLFDNPLTLSTPESDVLYKLLGDEYEYKLKHQMDLQRIARDTKQLLSQKARFRALAKPSHMRSQMIAVEHPNGNRLAISSAALDFNTADLDFIPSDTLSFNNINRGENAQAATNFFEYIWNDPALLTDVKTQVLQQLQFGARDQSPDFIYHFTLYHIFHPYLDDLDEEKIVKSKTGFKDSIVWNKLYKFQQDGVLGAIDKIEKYGGCIIADSVGLGKTFEALAVIKYYELRNDRVLVLCPKRLRENWTTYRLNDTRNILLKDRLNFDVLNHTDLSRERGHSGEINLETVNWGNYDLVVIDESHNFRNNNPSKKHIPRYTRLLDHIIRTGVKTKVLMLSATPVNNRMNDLKNQVAFITEAQDRAFEAHGVDSINATMRNAQAQFNRWLKTSTDKNVDQLLEVLDGRYFRLLDLLTIARSRKHIEKYYDLNEIGKFPERLPPINVKADIDVQGNFPPLRDINREIQRLNLSPYSPLKYVLPEKQDDYGDVYDLPLGGKSRFRQVDREESLIHLMRVNLLKRMESSINSFALTLERLVATIDLLLHKILIESEFRNDSLDIRELDIEDPLLEDFLIGKKVKVLMQDMDLVRWKQDLLEDKATLERTLADAKLIGVDRDAKLQSLKKKIEQKAQQPLNGGNRKVIVFTAFSDTAEYLYRELAPWAMENFNLHAGLVTGSGKNATNLPGIRKDLTDILTHFSPISKERSPDLEDQTEIDLLIATDCISEGQNLQDCDYLVNYDIHWNPVRIIQRFGRIDRLGSVNERIQLVNFWPNMELDEYIDLEARVSGRMVLLDVSATGEENVIDYKKEMNDLPYRKRQLEQLQNQVIDLEDIQGGISITDLTFNDFKMQLMERLKTEREALERTPQGIHAVVSTQEEDIPPGVIFCLRQRDSRSESQLEYNPIAPCYLNFIHENGDMTYSFLQSKRALDVYQKLCAGNKEVLVEMVELFEAETKGQKQMGSYTELLENSVAQITGKRTEKGTASLFHTGGTAGIKEINRGLDDFELVSYLVVKQG